jgi:hypothetical protein
MAQGCLIARLRKQRAEFRWPPGLATFDSQRWECRAAWHLARAYAPPSKLVALEEIKAAVRGPTGDVGRGGAVIVGPPGRLVVPL